MKNIKIIFVILLLSIVLVSANGDHTTEIEEGKKLVESNISCYKLNDEQLEAIGEYYMEQMHPGESHEAMHKMMGIEEGNEYHKQFHVNMAKRMYCNGGSMMGSCGMMGNGMMGMMNMMGGNMMGGQSQQTNMMQGMMGNNPLGFGYWSFWNAVWLLLWVGIIILIFWLIYKFTIKKEAINKNMWIWVFAVVALLLLFGSFGIGGFGMGGFGMMGFGFIFMLLFWGMLIWIIIAIINAAQPKKEKDDPSIILKKRYAAGEISKKQYEKMKKNI